MRSVNRQKASIAAVKKYGGWVYYDYEVDADGRVDPNPASKVPAWLLSLLGRDHFHDIVWVAMDFRKKGNRPSPEILQHLSGFPGLRILRLQYARETDRLRILHFEGKLDELYILSKLEEAEARLLAKCHHTCLSPTSPNPDLNLQTRISR